MTAELFTKRIANQPGFSPQSVPVVHVDADLPAIALSRQTPLALEQLFARAHQTPSGLSGGSASAHRLCADVHADLHANVHADVSGAGPRASAALAKAAVLLPIMRSEHPSVLLTQRSLSLSSHAGQIALPGGRVDPQDHSLAAAALREAQEEVGLQAQFVTVLGGLPPFQTNTGFEIWPVVGLVSAQAKPFLAPNPGEVDALFEVPLSFLLDPANHRHHHYRDAHLDRQWLSMPYHDVQAAEERYIWGVTAGILRSLYQFMQTP